MAKKLLKKSEYGPRLKKIKPEWSISKNNEPFPPSKKGSKFWWECKKGHEWEATYYNRVAHQSDCPYCSGRFVHPDNNLKKLYPNLCLEIHPSKNNKIDPEKIHPGTHKKIWWKCKKSHEWEAKIVMRTKGNNCPYCSGNLVSKDNNLKIMFPKVAKEWHPTKNGKNKPEGFLWGSKQKFWWLCKNGHEWIAEIGARTNKRGGTGCPKCTHQTSKNEMRIMAELSYIFKNIISRYRIKNTEIDIYIDKLKLGIEHDGSYWHKEKNEMDRKKNSFLEVNNIKLIRIRHHPLPKINSSDIILKVTQFMRKKDIDKLFMFIKKEYKNNIDENEMKLINQYLGKNNFAMESTYLKFLSYAPDPLPEHSAEHVAPKKVKEEWHPTKNKPLALKNFNRSSNQKVWWKCNKGHEWEATVGSRMNAHECPYCTNRYVCKSNNLEKMLPSIAAEWHPTKNGKLKPMDLTYRSKTKVWWKCKNGHEWENSVASRAAKNIIRQCRFCVYEGRKKKENQEH